MAKKKRQGLSRREREILHIVFSLGEATSAQIREQMESAPTGNAVRALIQNLETKGELVRIRKDGREYIYGPRENREKAGARALRQVIETFYQGSVATALASHFAGSKDSISPAEYSRLRQLIAEADDCQENDSNK